MVEKKISQNISWNTWLPAGLQGVTISKLAELEPQPGGRGTALCSDEQATFPPGAHNPYSEFFQQQIAKTALLFGCPQTQQGALGKCYL